MDHRGRVDVVRLVGRFDGACYFHVTRAVDPEAFCQGRILPLDLMVEKLWSTRRELAGHEITDDEWAEFRSRSRPTLAARDCSLYRLKTGARIHLGPFGLVVRETFLAPGSTGSHDYLGCPGIVQDIARCYASAHGGDLERCFREVAKPCIVKFRSPNCRPGEVKAALWHAFAKLRAGEITSNANYSLDGAGAPVPAEDVVDVEIITCT
jgi:hypothetical protein